LKQDTAIRLTIRSTPKDINQCNINQVFEKGYSESIESSKGLGLYITKLLLTQINGSIKARIANNEFIVEIVI
jgi:sensor histidine kinase regulating citrate/malate metabolism